MSKLSKRRRAGGKGGNVRGLTLILPVSFLLLAVPGPGAGPLLAAPAPVGQLPINLVYVNHVEVESVIDFVPPLLDGAIYATTPERYAFTSGQLEWEIAQAEAVGAGISFHMSGAYAERAVAAGDQALWARHLADGHTAGVHFHQFLRGPEPFQWAHSRYPSQAEIIQAWQDNHDLVAGLVGPEALWVGESHYGCQSCWESLGYRLGTTEQMALLPAGQHIVWLVERNPSGVIRYPHFPQIGEAGWHGPSDNRLYFDLRLPQLKKEFLMLYLEWLERERLNLAPQVWAWGWANHGGPATVQHATEIQEMLAWLSANFAGRTSPRGDVIAQFVSDHTLSDIYEVYEQSGGQPLPSPLTNVNDQFPYMAYALEDAGVVADLSNDLALAGIRLFELERNPPENPSPSPPRVYLLFRETDGSDVVDIKGVLASRGVNATRLTLIDVLNGTRSQVDPGSLTLGPTPLVVEPAAETFTTETVETWVTAPNGNRVYTRIVQPVPGLYPGRRFPALIAIPGGTGAGAPLADNPGYRNLAASGFVIVVFNPEGRGTGTPGNLRSDGTENCNGFVHQDDLKAIVEYTAALSNVLVRNIGVETASFGIAIGAGALGRYPGLPVAYLVDQEGPHDNRVITFYDVGRETAVCGHWSTVTDPSPANQAFWAEREAVRHIGAYPGMYLRMQAEIDHAQGPGYFRHTIEMIDAATRSVHGGTGSARWTRVNGADVGNPIDVAYALDEPTRYPVWVTGRLADHPGLNLAYDREMSALVDAGDFDGDGDVDADDAARFETCFTGAGGGPVDPECEPGDFEADGDIDCVDWGQFVLVWTQAGEPPVLSVCAAVPEAVTGLLLSAVGANFENLRMVWNPAASAVRYVIYSDTSPGGPFTTVFASGIATTSIKVPMPPDPVLYLKVAGVNGEGVEGPK
jgi:hypothetical protein